MYKNTPRTYFMGGATPSDRTMINRGVFFMGGADTSSQDWKDKPEDWADIRKDCPKNSIALYAGELGSNYIIEDGKLTWANPNIYLKGDGNSCILTDYAPSYKTSMDIKVGDVTLWICGARNSAGTIDFGIAYYLATFGKKILNFSSIQSGTYTFNYGQTLIRNGVTIGTFPETSLVGTTKMLLFGSRDENGTNGSLSSGKIYYCKIYDDNELLYHFVPVPQGLVIGDFTVPSNGMFDIVNQQFYANQGTGDFTYSKATISNDYDNLGFTATCEGGYNVFIDGVQYGSTYASGAQCNITWSTSGITTGDDITTPSALKAHKIWIEPATEGNNITAFHCARVEESGNKQLGVLWAHFNLSNEISLSSSFAGYNQYSNQLMSALTAKNNVIKVSGLAGLLGEGQDLFNYASNIEYLPNFDLNNNTLSCSGSFNLKNTAQLKTINLKNGNITGMVYFCANATNLTKINTKNINFSASNISGAFKDNYSLTELPENINYSSVTIANNYITNAKNLKDMVLDVSSAKSLTKIGCYADSNTYFMTGFKGLRVSNQAPFNNGTAPQINVKYTSMDRQALVTLFNDLPIVSSGQIINVTGCTGASSLTDEEIEIATNKGWTVTGGPAFQVFATFSGAQVGDTIKLNDGMATSDKNWSAYPSDTAVIGHFTQTATVTTVSGDTIECTRPTQDDKTITITTDENAEIEVIDNTAIQTITISVDQTADIETSTNVTTENNNVALTDGYYNLFNITVPQTMMAFIENNGTSLTPSDMPILVKNNSGVGLLLKNGNNVYYRNSWVITKDYNLHYQQINFSYPSGANVICKVNNVATDLTPYCYAGDKITWTCDNAGTVTTGTYTVKYNSKDGNIQTITIS